MTSATQAAVQNPSLWKNIEKRTDLQSLRSMRSDIESTSDNCNPCKSDTLAALLPATREYKYRYKYTNTNINIYTKAKKSTNVMNFIKSGR